MAKCTVSRNNCCILHLHGEWLKLLFWTSEEEARISVRQSFPETLGLRVKPNNLVMEVPFLISLKSNDVFCISPWLSHMNLSV